MSKIRVAVSGYGVIGRRVVDAVALQEDMEMVGIADVVGDYRLRRAQARGFAIYTALAEKHDEMKEAGIDVRGTLDDLLKKTEVVVDCTPKGIDARNKPLYESANVKFIFQGGAKHELTGHSFVASANYESAVGRNSTRVVSCNTTATVRTLTALRDAGLLKKACGVLIRGVIVAVDAKLPIHRRRLAASGFWWRLGYDVCRGFSSHVNQ